MREDPWSQRLRRIASGDLAGSDLDADGAEIVSRWQAAIRRVLLVAHLLPAIFGLIAVVGLRGTEDVFPLAISCWVMVLAWSAFLAIGGWNRQLSRRVLTGWVLADAAVMAGLMFVGTPVRPIVSYIAVDGALFAAAFVSSRLALVQLGIVYGALWAAATVRHAGSDLPEPLVGWLTPIVVALAGVLALSFIRSALDELEVALEGRQLAIKDERRLRAKAAQEEALVRDLGALEELIAPDLRQLEQLTSRYSVSVAEIGARQEEAAWLGECVGLASRELANLRELAAESDHTPLDEVVESAMLGAGGALLAEGAIDRKIDPLLAGRPLEQATARALGGFVREAVNNAVVHGGRPVLVSVRADGEGQILVSVSDPGEGYDPRAVTAGIGLGALSEYAQALEGTIEQRRSDDGHAVLLTMPEPV